MSETNRYSQIIEQIFFRYYKKGASEFEFPREDIEDAAVSLDIKLPKNIGDLIYSFRYRTPLPDSIVKLAPKGQHWIIRPVGRAKYQFALAKKSLLVPNEMLAEIKIADSTPTLVARYALSDEQALLAKVRYNRLIDIFTGVVCYSLQNHLRTTVEGMGQIETDELYIGTDTKGSQYVFPVQAKGGTDRLSIVQIEQDHALCKEKFPLLNPLPIAVQFMDDDLIAMFSFVEDDGEMKISGEKHYRLVPAEDIGEDDLQKYKS